MKALGLGRLRSISLVLTVTFVCQDLAFAAPAPAPAPWTPTAVPSLAFRLPESVARIEDGYTAPAVPGSSVAPKLIFLFQDAHTNESGQLNYAKALRTILPAEGIADIFTEAAQGDVSVTPLKQDREPAAMEPVALAYVRKGLLKGDEYLSLSSDLDFRIRGVEDPALYDASLEAYQSVAARRTQTRGYLDRLSRTAETLKQTVYGADLKKADAARTAYVRGEKSLADYFESLQTSAQQAGVYLPQYRHLSRLKRLRAFERKIDFQAVAAEQARALASLPESDRTELQAAAKGRSPFRFGGEDHAAEQGFYALLSEKLAKNDFPELSKYFVYLKTSGRMDAAGVLREMDALEDDVFARLCAGSQTAQLLARFSKNLESLIRMIELKLTPAEFESFRRDSRSFDIRTISGFFNKAILDLGKHYDRATLLDADYEAAEAEAVKFYELAYQRDLAFVDGTLRAMEADRLEKAVLVTGGFHTPHLKELLKQRGVSYVSIAPQVLHETDSARYEKLLFTQIASAKKASRLAQTRSAASVRDAAMTGRIMSDVMSGARMALEKDLQAAASRSQSGAARMAAPAPASGDWSNQVLEHLASTERWLEAVSAQLLSEHQLTGEAAGFGAASRKAKEVRQSIHELRLYIQEGRSEQGQVAKDLRLLVSEVRLYLTRVLPLKYTKTMEFEIKDEPAWLTAIKDVQIELILALHATRMPETVNVYESEIRNGITLQVISERSRQDHALLIKSPSGKIIFKDCISAAEYEHFRSFLNGTAAADIAGTLDQTYERWYSPELTNHDKFMPVYRRILSDVVFLTPWGRAGARMAGATIDPSRVVVLDDMDVAQLGVTGLTNLSKIKDAKEKKAALIAAQPLLVVVRSETKLREKVKVDAATGQPEKGFTVLFEEIPTLEGVIRGGHGKDNIDVDAGAARGIWTRSTDGSDRSVSALAMQFAALDRQRLLGTSVTRAADRGLHVPDLWIGRDSWRLAYGKKAAKLTGDARDEADKQFSKFDQALSSEAYASLEGASMGVIGAKDRPGNIASFLAQWAADEKMNVTVNARSFSKTEDLPQTWRDKKIRFGSQEEMFKQADYIVLLTGLTQSTKGMVGAQAVEWMIQRDRKPALINVDRGAVVDEKELLPFLEAGGRYLTDEEPKLPEIRNHPNVLFLPHIGGSTAEAEAGVLANTARILAELGVRSSGGARMTEAEFKTVVQQAGKRIRDAAEILKLSDEFDRAQNDHIAGNKLTEIFNHLYAGNLEIVQAPAGQDTQITLIKGANPRRQLSLKFHPSDAAHAERDMARQLVRLGMFLLKFDPAVHSGAAQLKLMREETVAADMLLMNTRLSPQSLAFERTDRMRTEYEAYLEVQLPEEERLAIKARTDAEADKDREQAEMKRRQYIEAERIEPNVPSSIKMYSNLAAKAVKKTGTLDVIETFWMPYAPDLLEALLIQDDNKKQEKLTELLSEIVNATMLAMFQAGLWETPERGKKLSTQQTGQILDTLAKALAHFARSRRSANEEPADIQARLVEAARTIQPKWQIYSYIRTPHMNIVFADAIRSQNVKTSAHVGQPQTAADAVKQISSALAMAVVRPEDSGMLLIGTSGSGSAGGNMLALPAPSGTTPTPGAAKPGAPAGAAAQPAAGLMDFVSDAGDYIFSYDDGYTANPDIFVPAVATSLNEASTFEQWMEQPSSEFVGGLRVASLQQSQPSGPQGQVGRWIAYTAALYFYPNKTASKDDAPKPGTLETAWNKFRNRTGLATDAMLIDTVETMNSGKKSGKGYTKTELSFAWYAAFLLHSYLRSLPDDEQASAAKTVDAALADLSQKPGYGFFQLVHVILVQVRGMKLGQAEKSARPSAPAAAPTASAAPSKPAAKPAATPAPAAPVFEPSGPVLPTSTFNTESTFDGFVERVTEVGATVEAALADADTEQVIRLIKLLVAGSPDADASSKDGNYTKTIRSVQLKTHPDKLKHDATLDDVARAALLDVNKTIDPISAYVERPVKLAETKEAVKQLRQAVSKYVKWKSEVTIRLAQQAEKRHAQVMKGLKKVFKAVKALGEQIKKLTDDTARMAAPLLSFVRNLTADLWESATAALRKIGMPASPEKQAQKILKRIGDNPVTIQLTDLSKGQSQFFEWLDRQTHGASSAAAKQVREAIVYEIKIQESGVYHDGNEMPTTRRTPVLIIRKRKASDREELPSDSVLFPGRTPSQIGSVHFGSGNFLRALNAEMVHQGYNRDVVIVQPRGTETARSLARNHGVYEVQVRPFDPRVPSHEIGVRNVAGTGSLSDSGWTNDLMRLARDPGLDLDFVFLSLTENGLSAENPAMESFVRFVWNYYQQDPEKARNLLVVNTDNVRWNGFRIRMIVGQLVSGYSASDGLKQNFIAWFDRAMANSMVDRIATRNFSDPSTPAVEEAPQTLVAIHADRIPGRARVRLKSVSNFKIRDTESELELDYDLKLRILNATHTAMAHVSVLLGIPTTREALATPEIRNLVQRLFESEIRPALVERYGESGEDVRERMDALFDEWINERVANPHIDHANAEIAKGGIFKIKERLIPTIADNGGWAGPVMALTIASVLRSMTPIREAQGQFVGVNAAGVEYPVVDTTSDFGARVMHQLLSAREAWEGGSPATAEEFLKRALDNFTIQGEQTLGSVDAAAEIRDIYFRLLESDADGVRNLMREAMLGVLTYDQALNISRRFPFLAVTGGPGAGKGTAIQGLNRPVRTFGSDVRQINDRQGLVPQMRRLLSGRAKVESFENGDGLRAVRKHLAAAAEGLTTQNADWQGLLDFIDEPGAGNRLRGQLQEAMEVMNAGKVISADTLLAFMSEALQHVDRFHQADMVVVDGSPRRTQETDMLTRGHVVFKSSRGPDLYVAITVPDDEMRLRLGGRNEGRADDADASKIEERIREYHQTVDPAIRRIAERQPDRLIELNGVADENTPNHLASRALRQKLIDRILEKIDDPLSNRVPTTATSDADESARLAAPSQSTYFITALFRRAQSFIDSNPDQAPSVVNAQDWEWIRKQVGNYRYSQQGQYGFGISSTDLRRLDRLVGTLMEGELRHQHAMYRLRPSGVDAIEAHALSEILKGRNGDKTSSLAYLNGGSAEIDLAAIVDGVSAAMFIDLGGSNLRVGVSEVVLNGDKYEVRTVAVIERRIPDDIKKSGGKELFDFIANTIADFVRDELPLHPNCRKKLFDAEGQAIGGITFSFPQKDGIIEFGANDVKEFNFRELTGEKTDNPDAAQEAHRLENANILELVNNRIAGMEGMEGIRFVTVGNDTDNLLRLGLVLEPNTVAGDVTGTGFNIAALIEGLIINLEAGGLSIPDRDEFLNEIQQAVAVRGAENLIAGKFMGEFARLVIRGLWKRGLFASRREGKLWRKVFEYPENDKYPDHGFKTASVMQLAYSKKTDDLIRLMEYDLGLNYEGNRELALTDLRILQAVASGIAEGSAQVNAAILSAVVKSVVPEEPSAAPMIAADGTVWEKNPEYVARVNQLIGERFSEGAFNWPKSVRPRVFLALDASGRGAALHAMLHIYFQRLRAGLIAKKPTGDGSRMAAGKRKFNKERNRGSDNHRFRSDARKHLKAAKKLIRTGAASNIEQADHELMLAEKSLRAVFGTNEELQSLFRQLHDLRSSVEKPADASARLAASDRAIGDFVGAAAEAIGLRGEARMALAEEGDVVSVLRLLQDADGVRWMREGGLEWLEVLDETGAVTGGIDGSVIDRTFLNGEQVLEADLNLTKLLIQAAREKRLAIHPVNYKIDVTALLSEIDAASRPGVLRALKNALDRAHELGLGSFVYSAEDERNPALGLKRYPLIPDAPTTQLRDLRRFDLLSNEERAGYGLFFDQGKNEFIPFLSTLLAQNLTVQALEMPGLTEDEREARDAALEALEPVIQKLTQSNIRISGSEWLLIGVPDHASEADFEPFAVKGLSLRGYIDLLVYLQGLRKASVDVAA